MVSTWPSPISPRPLFLQVSVTGTCGTGSRQSDQHHRMWSPTPHHVNLNGGFPHEPKLIQFSYHSVLLLHLFYNIKTGGRFMRWMRFKSANQQCQSTEGNNNAEQSWHPHFSTSNYLNLGLYPLVDFLLHKISRYHQRTRVLTATVFTCQYISTSAYILSKNVAIYQL